MQKKQGAISMIKFTCNKLSRDKTVERMQKSNVKIDYKTIEGQELLDALNKKIIEEAQEVVEAKNKDELTFEIADLLEVIDVLCAANNIDMQTILKAKQEKLEQRGSFSKGIFTESIEMEEDNKWASHFRQSPGKEPNSSIWPSGKFQKNYTQDELKSFYKEFNVVEFKERVKPSFKLGREFSGTTYYLLIQKP